MPCPVMLVVDRTTNLLAEARVGFSVVKVEFVAAKEFELVYGEAKFPGDVGPMDRSGDDFLWGFVFCCSVGRGHGVVLKY